MPASATVRSTKRAVRHTGFPLSPALVLRPRAAIGGTVLIARLVLEYGLACNTAGGSHHAFTDHGAGFCLFNDVAVTIHVLQTEGRIRRALVVDLDVHTGDGTAQIFTGDDSIFTFSMLCADNFPLRKQTGDLDVALPADIGDETHLTLLVQHLGAAINRARPETAFFSAGVDPHREDRLGRLALTDAGLKERERLVLQMCLAAGLPVACVIGGGYSDDTDRLARRHAVLHHTAAHLMA